eukprot:2998958-Pyramimonas_sp.AAC.1
MKGREGGTGSLVRTTSSSPTWAAVLLPSAGASEGGWHGRRDEEGERERPQEGSRGLENSWTGPPKKFGDILGRFGAILAFLWSSWDRLGGHLGPFWPSWRHQGDHFCSA